MEQLDISLIRQMISENKTLNALLALQEFSDHFNRSTSNSIVLIKARYTRNEQAKELGILSGEEYSRELNKINNFILKLNLEDDSKLKWDKSFWLIILNIFLITVSMLLGILLGGNTNIKLRSENKQQSQILLGINEGEVSPALLTKMEKMMKSISCEDLVNSTVLFQNKILKDCYVFAKPKKNIIDTSSDRSSNPSNGNIDITPKR